MVMDIGAVYGERGVMEHGMGREGVMMDGNGYWGGVWGERDYGVCDGMGAGYGERRGYVVAVVMRMGYGEGRWGGSGGKWDGVPVGHCWLV